MTPTSARDQILQRIARASEGSRTIDVPRTYQGLAGPGNVELFVERLRDYKARVERIQLGELSLMIGECMERRGAARIIVPDGIAAEWLTAISAVISNDAPTLSALELKAFDGVLTTCAVAIAETGTVVLTHGAGQGRRALTLVPDYHLVVVFEHQIVSGVPGAVSVLDGTETMTWISGPSATSDIELSRVEGVHGPRNLEVLVVR
jgi:L-lactate dehydrogenase complex protein LldG